MNISKSKLNSISALFLLALFSFVVSIPLLNLGFFGDDTHSLNVVSEHTLFQLLFHSPGHKITKIYFTPFLASTFRLDWFLFGTNFKAYTLHNMIWLWLVGCSAFILLRRLKIDVLGAFLGASFLVCSPAVVSVSGDNSSRHYLFGLVYSLISLSVILNWSEKKGRIKYGIALLFYFLAALSKEIYFPLFLIAPILIKGDQKSRKDVLIGYTSVAFIYLVLRRIVLGTFIGGYGKEYHFLYMVSYLIRSWPRLTETLVWGDGKPGDVFGIAVVLGNLLVFLTLYLAWRSAKRKGLLIMIFLIIMSLSVVSFILGHPIIRYADDSLYCVGDRLASLFSAVIVLGFTYFLFTSYHRDKNNKKFIICVIITFFIYNGYEKARQWQLNKIDLHQINFMEKNLNSDVLFIGDPRWHLNNYIKLLEKKEKDIKARAIDFGAKLEDYKEMNYNKVYLLLPGEGVRKVRSQDEFLAWIKKYESVPIGGILRNQ